MALGVFLNSTEEMEKENILNTDPWSSCSAGNCSNQYNKGPHFRSECLSQPKMIAICSPQDHEELKVLLFQHLMQL